ncbi:MAG TPA: dihydropteroate synthase [Acidimicrobiales bacterium]|nr:dihydropteroate synthase [Acidimicrobiales bacterium]
MNRPLIMGVLNVTPDSFSDGGQYLDVEAAVAHGVEMMDQGADVIDVGGASTRPGSVLPSADEERARVVPVVARLAALGRSRVSIDTMTENVARAAVAAGATLVNDVSASLWRVAAEAGVGWAAMHMQGSPATMQADPHYGDVVAEVLAYLVARAEAATAAGVAEVWIDPGFGFGKSLAHNLTLLAHLDQFCATPYPVLVGLSRKSMLGALTPNPDGSIPPPSDRLEASIASVVFAATKGVGMVRVHDVPATVAAVRIVCDEVGV